jgi:hypothetical protein
MDLKKIVRIIESEKRKAESDFRKSIGLESEAVSVESSDVEIVYPKQDRIEDIGKMLKEHSPEEIKEALRGRKGEVYEILSERGKIIRMNFENRFEIAKLTAMLVKLNEKEKAEIKKAIRIGKFDEPMDISSLDEEKRERLAKFMQRCGITCSVNESQLSPKEAEEKEVPMRVENRNVWLSAEASDQLDSNLKRIHELGSQLQVKNAKRHIMVFNEEEEKVYNELQHEYLTLLKQQDELLKEYNAEMS